MLEGNIEEQAKDADIDFWQEPVISTAIKQQYKLYFWL